MFPSRSDLVIQFSHVAYQFEAQFAKRDTGITNYSTWTPEDTAERISEADVIVATGFWRNAFLDSSPRLKLIQVAGAGYDQFDTDAIRARGIRMVNGRGVNTNAVAEHAMALILGLSRQIHLARDAQRGKIWRGMNPDIPTREEELAGKTMLIIGAGQIGARIATLGKAFGMRVAGMKRDIATIDPAFDAVHPMTEKLARIAEADIVVLCCPLTPQTRELIDAAALSAMRPSACLINVARGGCVVEADLVAALEAGTIAAAGIDVTEPEPLPESSALWGMENVLLTPHTGGETRRYEDNVLDILIENIERLERGETELHNQIV
jgi:phosphoglycerate dehydrogenase-like enzyme